MNRLEILGNYLNSMISAETIQLEDHKPVGEAAAILLAASKVDVAGLMTLIRAYGGARHDTGYATGTWRFDDKDIFTKEADKTYGDLETALRMALAVREPIDTAMKEKP